MDPILAFAMATALIVATPGPTVLLVITQAASHGPRSVLPLVTGVLLGDFTAMSLSLLGLGAMLATSATPVPGLQMGGGRLPSYTWACAYGAPRPMPPPYEAGARSAGARSCGAHSSSRP